MEDGTIRCTTFLDKGGTGKTTAVAHFGVAAAREGHDVLLIDLAGKQGDLAKHFGVWSEWLSKIRSEDDDADWPNVSTLFTDEWPRIVRRASGNIVEEVIIETAEGVDMIPAHPGLDGLDGRLERIDTKAERYAILDGVLTEHIEPLGYDLILIDLPGSTSNIAYNGVYAARNVLAPVEMGPFESEQMSLLAEELTTFRERFADARIAMVLPNKVDLRTSLANEYLDDYNDRYPDTIAPEPIPVSQDIRNAADQGQTVFELDKPSETARRAREAFVTDCRELINRLQ